MQLVSGHLHVLVELLSPGFVDAPHQSSAPHTGHSQSTWHCGSFSAEQAHAILRCAGVNDCGPLSAGQAHATLRRAGVNFLGFDCWNERSLMAVPFSLSAVQARPMPYRRGAQCRFVGLVRGLWHARAGHGCSCVCPPPCAAVNALLTGAGAQRRQPQVFGAGQARRHARHPVLQCTLCSRGWGAHRILLRATAALLLLTLRLAGDEP